MVCVQGYKATLGKLLLYCAWPQAEHRYVQGTCVEVLRNAWCLWLLAHTFASVNHVGVCRAAMYGTGGDVVVAYLKALLVRVGAGFQLLANPLAFGTMFVYAL